MNRTPRRIEIAAMVLVLVVFATIYVLAVAAEPRSSTMYRDMALVLVFPTLLWVLAAFLLVRFGSGATRRPSTLDAPGRLLAVAVATLPDHRREWGAAMAAELAGITEPAARWRFALSCVPAALWLPGTVRAPLLVATTVVAVVAVAAADPMVGSVVPGLALFATVFAAVLGGLAVVSVARSHGIRGWVGVPTIVVVIGVVASVAATVDFLREPARYVPTVGAVLFAGALALCLWAARPGTGDRLAAYVGVGAGLAFAVGLLAQIRGGQAAVGWLLGMPALVFFVPAFIAAVIGRSFRSGVRTGVWTAIAAAPMTYAVMLYEELRQSALDGTSVLDGDYAPVGASLASALVVLALIPVAGFPFAVMGAAVGSTARRPAVAPERAAG
jgi:hypothetical protein